MNQPEINEARVLQDLRWRMFRNSLDVMLRQSFIRVFTILLCCLVIWGTLFIISYYGFMELRTQWKLSLKETPIAILFNASFVVLSILLTFSTGIILFSSLYGSREGTFLLSSPLGEDHIFVYKFQSAVAFSSWAFLLLGSPILLAFGLKVSGGAPWYFYVLVPLFFFGFVLIPGSIGALLCLLLVRFFPRHRKQAIILISAAIATLLVVYGYTRFLPNAKALINTPDALTELLGDMSVIHSPLLPAFWLSEGMRMAALHELSTSIYYFCLIWSNGLFLYVITVWVAKKTYRQSFDFLASSGSLKRRFGTTILDRLFAIPLSVIDKQTRMLILKDFRCFRRDPSQWGQVLILVGLATLYLYNIRTFYRQDIGKPFQNGISLLNLVATSLGLCAFTGRFVFPMLSLEGTKFWILGLLPLERSRLIFGKFVFSSVTTLAMGQFMVLLSDIMLNLPWSVIGLHVVAMTFLAVGMSALSVGMGATMPNFRETDPSKIAVGFGGTITLITGLLYQVALIVMMVLPTHLIMAIPGDVSYEEKAGPSTLAIWANIGIVGGLLVGIIAIWLPLYAGIKALKKMEF